MKNDLYDSKFIIKTDPHKEKLIFKLPETWWSRGYEYAWAGLFVKRQHVVLDAGCGLTHPFKYFLAGECRELYACDIDERILLPEDTLKDIERDFGKEAAEEINEKYLYRVNFIKADLKCLPFDSEKFDLVYSISVLEHMTYEDIITTLSEFKRVLNENGLIILTFDYPSIDLEYFKNIVEDVRLEFAGNLFLHLPDNAVTSDVWGKLYCFRAVLRKPN